jgi:hypothetical protein
LSGSSVDARTAIHRRGAKTSEHELLVRRSPDLFRGIYRKSTSSVHLSPDTHLR